MATEDFTTYTEIDSGGKVTVSEDTITLVGTYSTASSDCIYYDFTAGYFSGDIAQKAGLQGHLDDEGIYGYKAYCVQWMLTDTQGRVDEIINASGNAMGILIYKLRNSNITRFYTFEIYNGSLTLGEYAGDVTPTTIRYSIMKRVDTTFTWELYTDSTYSTISESHEIALSGAPDYRYVQIGGGYNDGSTSLIFPPTFVTLLIVSLTAPTVTTQVVKDVVGTTATGQGNVTDLGGFSVTQHGHCWDTSTDPTTTDSGSGYWGKTSLGVKSAIGAFESSLTNLTPGTGYYVRTYATNSLGTSYGANIYFVASKIRAGYIWMEGSNLRGFDENAIERKYIHTDDFDDHSTRHENSGDDEISVEGLSGLLADDQHVLDSELNSWLSTKEADYAPSAMSVDVGNLDTGSYTDLAALGGTDVAISETTGADPLRVTLTFSSVTLVPNNVLIYGYYGGGFSHHMNCEIYNIDTTSWDLIGILDYETAKMWYSFPLFNGSVYVDGSNDVQVRLRHDGSGNVNHDLYLDYFLLQRSFGTGGGAAAVLDSPMDGESHIAISANWAYGHEVIGEHSEIHLTPKSSSSGAEGTIFYNSDDNSVYVGTEV